MAAARAAVLVAMAMAVAAAAYAGTAMRTTAQGAYTAEQALRGRAVYEQHCARCHDDSYFRNGFLVSWQDQPVSLLYDLIELKMPEDQPGTLKPCEYAAFLAYVFQLNGMPPGRDELPSAPEHLKNVLISE